MATFQPFPRLPLEIRIQIWGYSAVESRVVKVQKLFARTVLSSPTAVPGVTRACQESRRYCSYVRAFTVDGYPNYIWVDFESDIIQTNSSVVHKLATGQSHEKNEIRHLRIELVDSNGWDESESFYHEHSHKIRDFPKLHRCDILVHDGLHSWVDTIILGYWGTCPKDNVRMVDARTGEWINANTAGAWCDWVDTGCGAHKNFTRVDDWYDDDDEERYKDMMAAMKEPLPRIELSFQAVPRVFR